jgi:predicted transcriptional regulator of viral defense system
MRDSAKLLIDLASTGRYHFTNDDARKALGVSAVAVRAVLRRMKARGEIADPHRGFHVIIPPEYRRLGCLPPEQFVPQLMEHVGEYYYVALLSAAEFHGAAHHRPQTFQVMVKSNRRLLECGEVRVQFVARKDLDRTRTVEKNTPRGTLRISSPEATAFELVGYADQCGGLDNVASVINELVEVLNTSKLVEAAQECPIAWVQRLGYLLDLTNHVQVADPLVKHIQAHATVVAPLVRSQSTARARREERWKLAINANVEPDL